MFYVECKEIICYFFPKLGGGVCNKMGGLTFNEKFINWGIVINGNGKKINLKLESINKIRKNKLRSLNN